MSTTNAEPSIHRQREQDFIRHVERLLEDDRLRVDTTRGRRPVSSCMTKVDRTDRAVDLKRVMAEMNRPDRDLQNQMPVGETLDVTLAQRRLMVLRTVVGQLKVVCVSPTRSLIAGQDPQPLKPAEVQKLLGEVPPSTNGVPSTVVLMSTSGFTLEAHELAVRRADRTVVMVEPNKAGGWAVYGPVETKALVDLFDPEAEDSKRSRVREEIESAKAELTGSGIAGDRIASKTQLPLQLVEAELKAYAKANTGLLAKRLDGRVVLFREGSVPTASNASASAGGGGEMPLIDRIKTLFARKGENEKKIAFLSERRTALSQQRDRSYEDMSNLEQQEAALRRSFKEATGDITKRRVTSQLLQLRKEIERRQQLLAVLNQQINVVSTHLHNLELVQQGQGAKLPDSEEVAADAAKAEEMLAQLEADNELAASVGGITSGAGMSAEEQALFEELERESGGGSAAEKQASEREQSPAMTSTTTPRNTSREPIAAPSPAAPEQRRAEPEAG
ncbi:MAG TPA: hypothetical protein VLI90_08295 [Tepidisphaeraceae bacterium]|nr:hypothetical protein [Tepidisphaeraceae bacterium]